MINKNEAKKKKQRIKEIAKKLLANLKRGNDRKI